MAFMRRGLATKPRSDIPSIHSKTKACQPDVDDTDVDDDYADDILEEDDDSQSTIGLLRTVTKVVAFPKGLNKEYIVTLKCGHNVKSSSAFQGFCKECKI